MDLTRLQQVSATEWRIPQTQRMRVPGIIYGTEALLREMDDCMNDTGPLDTPPVDVTRSLFGRRREKSYPTPPPV